MKSIILLLLTACCLFPFSSTTFTSKNPIILPTTTVDNDIVLDSDGNPLTTGEKYIIRDLNSTADVYWWGNIGVTPCPNTVMEGNVGNGTAVKFVLNTYDDVVREGVEINIMFSIETSSPCVNEGVWGVGDWQFLVTGGILGSKRNIFKIEEFEGEVPGVENVYKLRYCPPHYQCENVCTTQDNEYLRLTIFPLDSSPFIFVKEKNA